LVLNNRPYSGAMRSCSGGLERRLLFCGSAVDRGGLVRRYCLTLDLQDDVRLIEEYKRYHRQVWPEITKSIRDSGVYDMEIYLLGTRLFMIVEVEEGFSFEAKHAADRENAKVQEWEALMWKFQKALPQARLGEKWMLMERIFKLDAPKN